MSDEYVQLGAFFESPFYVAPKTNPSDPPTPATFDSKKSTLSKLNPLNYMFSSISQERAPNQTVDLPVDRETSSIPRGDSNGLWEYPSPQQMYNAMLRKGYTDTPQDAVEAMVAVHNFLNEGAWEEIEGWERLFAGGLMQGWNKCRRGEENIALDAARDELTGAANSSKPSLVRFKGRPQELTPKAQILQALGQALLLIDMTGSSYDKLPPAQRKSGM
ncbi:hypothetical protein EYZ11_011817 [Aspergillus tanneri]|uniref:Holocytochrome c-type synthase n=1 Tax=Aspergillus tanneri TaxID=1220188 RepID=A0A4S3J770_9EURO|nr:hypothetical protein EYZ11_011817 [Aspergillus tanneri]